jgi:hypothetical protein
MARPPRGVIGPSQEKLIFVITCVLSKYILNENKHIPVNANKATFLITL